MRAHHLYATGIRPRGIIIHSRSCWAKSAVSRHLGPDAADHPVDFIGALFREGGGEIAPRDLCDRQKRPHQLGPEGHAAEETDRGHKHSHQMEKRT